MKSEEYVCCISFPWDCSSIGQSTALSRRKLRVRAPSVLTNPINNNPIKKNTSIHLFIFCKRGTNSRISFPKGILIIILYYLQILYLYIYRFYIYIFIFFIFVFHQSKYKYGHFHFFNQYRWRWIKTHVDQYNYWQRHIQDSKRDLTEFGLFDSSRSV